MERVLLVATAHGLRASLLCHAMEWPDGPEGPVTPRWAARTVLAAGRVSG
ncbi:hypothetical protein [Streptomyces sp. NPDC057623]